MIVALYVVIADGAVGIAAGNYQILIKNHLILN
jgi:hypothetical protein